MNSQFISFGNSRFHYERYGNGPAWVFCFHGYGESASSFAVFEPYLGREFTLIAIEAPFHGKTDWKEELLFEPADLVDLMNRIMGNDQQPVILFGYSMGGRMAMKLFELIPHRVKRMVLVAPDGLHKNKWQWFTTQTLLGNRLFNYTMLHPGWMFALLKLAESLNLINRSVAKFVHHYLDDPLQREQLYKRWTTNRRFRPDLKKVKHLIGQYQVPVHLLFGKHDRIIIAKRGYQFSRNLEHQIKVTELEAGHLLLQEKYANIIAAFFVSG